jgi:hypothetical protein
VNEKIDQIQWEISDLRKRQYDDLILLGKYLSEYNKTRTTTTLREVEFKVFSQWGDDGIIQYIIQKLKIKNRCFVEFGVENYAEANTRFLLCNDNWSGLVIDSSAKNIQYIRNDRISWAHALYSKQAFITAENINNLLGELPFGQHVGLLSIDIDGNDYWVWNALTSIDADIVIVEYNSCFGPENLWTIPYQADFVRSRTADEISYFGASLGALCNLAQHKGYDFIGCNSAGNNAYFVKKEINNFFKPLTAQEGFVESKFAEGLKENGERVRGKERVARLKGMPIYNLKTNRIETI